MRIQAILLAFASIFLVASALPVAVPEAELGVVAREPVAEAAPVAAAYPPDYKREALAEPQTPDWRRSPPDYKKREAAPPDYRRSSPDYKRQTPDWKRQTPDWKRQTPDWKRQTPDWKRQTPDWKRQTPDWKRQGTPDY